MQRLKFNLEVNFGHLLIIASLAIQGIIYTTAIKTDLTVMRRDVERNTVDINRHQESLDKLLELQETASRQLAVQQEQLQALQATIGLHR